MATTRASAPGRRTKRGAGRPRVPAGSREALLAAGTELFAERGFDGVSEQAIARKAGVNPAMISYHFGSKRELYMAILAAPFGGIVAEGEDLAAPPRACAAWWARGVGPAGARGARARAEPVRVMAAVQRIVERGVREGSFRSVDPLLTHLSLVGSLVFFFPTMRFRQRLLRDRLHREPPAGAPYIGHLQARSTEGLATREAGSGRAGRRS